MNLSKNKFCLWTRWSFMEYIKFRAGWNSRSVQAAEESKKNGEENREEKETIIVIIGNHSVIFY